MKLRRGRRRGNLANDRGLSRPVDADRAEAILAAEPSWEAECKCRCRQVTFLNLGVSRG